MKRIIRRQIAISAALICARGFCGYGFWNDDLLQQGGHAFDRGDYKEAIRLLEAARERSSDCKVSFYLGLSRYRLKQLDQAIVDLASAVNCDPHSTEFLTALGEVFEEKGDDNRALGRFESALNLDPNNVGLLRATSAIYLRHDMSDQALRVLKKLVTLDKGDARAHSDLAATYAANGQFSEAEEYFQEALSLNPKDVSTLIGLGNLYIKTGRYDQAVEVLTRSIGLDTAAYQPLVLRGQAYTKLKRYQEAIADLQRAIQMGGRDPEIQYYLAQTYRAVGREEDFQRSLAAFKSWRESSNRDNEALREAGRLTDQARSQVMAGNLPEGIALMERARNISPHNGPILFRLAGLYLEDHQYERAETSIQEALELAPSQWDYHYLLGLIAKSEGKSDIARQSLETAVRLNSSCAEAYNQLGELAMSRHEIKTAIQDFEQAVQLAPQELVYKSNLENARHGSSEP